MLHVDTKFEISKESVPQFEQAAIIKFLSKENTPDYEIFCRLKRIYKNNTLNKEIVYAISSRFSENATTSDASTLEDCLDVVRLTVNEDGAVFSVDSHQNLEPVVPNSSLMRYISRGDDTAVIKNSTLHKEKGSNSPSKRKTLMSKKAYLQTEFKEEAPDIELEYMDVVDTDDKGSDDTSCSLQKAVFEKAMFDEQQTKGIDLENIKLPFLSNMPVENVLEVLMKLHTGYVCMLCDPKDFQYQSSLRRHMLMAHARRTVELDDQLSVRCRRSCVKYSKGHFHCSKCIKAFMTQTRLFMHFQRHFFKNGGKGSKPASLLESKVIHTRCLCVDSDAGVFMVQKSDFGSKAPIHVQKTSSFARCSELLCQKAMSIASQRNKAGFECKHLQRVSSNTSCKVEVNGCDVNLVDTFSCRNKECVELMEFARRKNVSPVVEWSVNDALVYYSVICQTSWCYRTLVQYIPEGPEFKCSTCICASCSHCDLVKLHLEYK